MGKLQGSDEAEGGERIFPLQLLTLSGRSGPARQHQLTSMITIASTFFGHRSPSQLHNTRSRRVQPSYRISSSANAWCLISAGLR